MIRSGIVQKKGSYRGTLGYFYHLYGFSNFLFVEDGLKVNSVVKESIVYGFTRPLPNGIRLERFLSSHLTKFQWRQLEYGLFGFPRHRHPFTTDTTLLRHEGVKNPQSLRTYEGYLVDVCDTPHLRSYLYRY